MIGGICWHFSRSPWAICWPQSLPEFSSSKGHLVLYLLLQKFLDQMLAPRYKGSAGWRKAVAGASGSLNYKGKR